MKKFNLFVAIFLFAVTAFAQAPEKMNYQAVVRNGESALVVNQSIGMKISILQGSPTGSEVYSETQTPQTNANGLVSIEIGNENGFAAIDWSNGLYFLKTEIDPTGGTNYSIVATQQLLSVPFALYAENAGNAESDDDLEDVLARGNEANAQIKSVTDPTENQDATTKSYVDALIAALDARVAALESGSDEIVDADGNVYTSVVIGSQEWMAQNLKTTKYNDGTEIPNVTNNTEWTTLSTPAYCWFNNDITNKDQYGALYNWFAVNTGNLCPTGWHVPSDEEWTNLTDYLATQGYTGGDSGNDAIPLKSTTGWDNNGNGTDVYGFTAFPGGGRSSHDGNFENIGITGNWWSATDIGPMFAFYRSMYYDRDYVSIYGNYNPFGFSVRCLRD